MEEIARKRFELENNIKEENLEEIYKYDEETYTDLLREQPWLRDVSYFKKVKISAIALIKMAMHARSGGDIEIMGLLQGKVDGDTMIVMDAFALPVEGTETRVNAQTEAYEYMSQYFTLIERCGKKEKAIGWYHSHPGYGCWLSGIDVSTQMLNQQFQEPWLAIVIDPKRTISSGKVEISAFRTYPEGYKLPDEPPSEYQTIPLNKIEDFGVHCKQYYSLETTFFKSSLDSTLLDLLWNKYWINTLSSSPIYLNRDYTSGQIMDLADKLKQAETQLSCGLKSKGLMRAPAGSGGSDSQKESQIARLTKDCIKTTSEQIQGLTSQVIKDYLFNNFIKAQVVPVAMELS